ncbi:MAG: glycosyltransferase family 39 protein [Bacteroidales bacterium]|nr:glycosyltransferase family 39 protein [Bacteroidales bacterium]
MANWFNLHNKNLKVLLLFFSLAFILRFFSFFPSVIDHDESTYLEISRMMLSGKDLYVDMIDIKPPGIFLIIAGIQAMFGFSVFVIRLVAALWIVATSFMINKTVRLMVSDEKAAYAAGIIYIFFISTWTFYGISITPEIYFNLFTISSLYLLLRKQSRFHYFLAGLLSGFGFIIKYLVLFDFMAFMLFFLIIDFIKNNKLHYTKILMNYSVAGLGLVVPFAATNLYFYLNGNFEAFSGIVYLAPGRYQTPFEPWKMLKFILEFHLFFLPIFAMFYYVIFHNKRSGNLVAQVRLLCAIWSILALLSVVITGMTFGHYTIQLMLPVSIVAGIFFMPGIFPVILDKPNRTKAGRILLAACLIAITLSKLEYVVRKDLPKEIANYLKPRLEENDVIYCGNYQHIIYYLLKKDSPTKYIHRSLLLNHKHIRALDIDVAEEFRKIMVQKPVYILVEKEYPDGMMKDYIRSNYTLEKEFDKKVRLYRIRGK